MSAPRNPLSRIILRHRESSLNYRSDHNRAPKKFYCVSPKSKAESIRKSRTGRKTSMGSRLSNYSHKDMDEYITTDGDNLASMIIYDLLVIATGSHIRPEETAGMLGEHWHRSVFDFYTLEGATKLRGLITIT